MVEIVRVTLVLVLKFVEEIEELEGEGGFRPSNCSGEPTCTEKLDASRNAISRRATATILNDDAMGPIQIEDHEVVGARGFETRVTGRMTKLDLVTECGEGG